MSAQPDRLAFIVAAHVSRATPGIRLKAWRPMACMVKQVRSDIARWMVRWALA